MWGDMVLADQRMQPIEYDLVRRRSAARRFFGYVFDYKTLLVFAVVAGLGKFALNYSFPWLIGAAVDRVIAPPAGTPRETRVQWVEQIGRAHV